MHGKATSIIIYTVCIINMVGSFNSPECYQADPTAKGEKVRYSPNKLSINHVGALNGIQVKS
jgi:hypothetical protein